MRAESVPPAIEAVEVLESLLERLSETPELADKPVAAALLASLALGFTGDSRSFARNFGIAHALVLREVTSLQDELGLIEVTREDERSSRRFLEITAAGWELLSRIGPGSRGPEAGC